MGTSVDTFGSRLRHTLTAQNLGVRTLAKRMTAQDPSRLEGVRRRLNKYVNEGVTPTASARHEIEDALGVDRDSLLVVGEDDEEEASDMVSELFRQAVDAAVDARFEKLMRRAGVVAA